MREIKFRCWDTKNKEWHTPTEWGEEPADAYIGYGEIPEIGFRSNDQYVWLQYTGLKDKNGKEIYEGDIRKAEYFSSNEKVVAYNVIKWDEKNACYYWDGQEFPDFVETEVIGNIYENPNLLSQDK